ncbi:MAG: PmoA family protein, partial [Candidatus Aminicenantes bacterium]|nr:PmoA family protein [Candidatus Aminicenantes bacterium]
VVSRLVWEMDAAVPLLDETRTMILHDLGEGESLLDIRFELKASHGDVEFVSDDVHYAWPYLRMHPRFNGENGGTITSDSGAKGQEATNMLPALWIDYSAEVEGVMEGVAVFQWPDGEDHRWLTREYGCFGPRRADRLSGKPFILEKGFSMKQRVGVLVHSGDVAGGRVAERYQQYIKGHWR